MSKVSIEWYLKCKRGNGGLKRRFVRVSPAAIFFPCFRLSKKSGSVRTSPSNDTCQNNLSFSFESFQD